MSDNREYEIPLEKYVGRNFYDCPRDECKAVFHDREPFEKHLDKCCPGLTKKFPTFAASTLGCVTNTSPDIQQYVRDHPPMN